MTNEEHTSRPYITLDWADVEAWVKRNPRTTTNWRGGYNTACPVPTHEPPNQRLSVWDSEDDRVALKCWGGCEYWDVLAAIDKAIKTSVSPGSEPQPTAEARTEELEQTLAATKAELDQERTARSTAEARIIGFRGATKRARKEERDALASDIRGLKEDLADARDREKQHAQELAGRDSHIKELEDDLVESKRNVLTFDFLEAWSDLEDKLKPVKRELIQNVQKSDVANQLRRAHNTGRINDQQFMNLGNMSDQRNDVVHNKLLLTTSQARAHLGILKQVIDQL